VLPFNGPGFLAFLLAFGGAEGLMFALKLSGEPTMMMIAGPLLAALDLLYRLARQAPFLKGRGGPTILFLPAWIWGIAWAGLGAWYELRG